MKYSDLRNADSDLLNGIHRAAGCTHTICRNLLARGHLKRGGQARAEGLSQNVVSVRLLGVRSRLMEL